MSDQLTPTERDEALVRLFNEAVDDRTHSDFWPGRFYILRSDCGNHSVLVRETSPTYHGCSEVSFGEFKIAVIIHRWISKTHKEDIGHGEKIENEAEESEVWMHMERAYRHRTPIRHPNDSEIFVAHDRHKNLKKWCKDNGEDIAEFS